MKRFITFILLALALAGAGYAGWTYWQKQKDKKSSNNTQTQTDPSEGGKYLVIKEWGVRFEVPQQYRGDVYYSFSDSSISLGSKKYAAINTDCAPEQVGMGAVIRKASNTPPSPGDEHMPPLTTVIDGFNYYTMTSQAVCDSSHVDEIVEEGRIIRQAIAKTLTAIR